MWKMKDFAVQVEEAREGQDGKPSIGPIYHNLLSKNEFPPPDHMATTWYIFSFSVKYPRNNRLGWRTFVDGKGCRIGIYGADCPQWILAMEACNAHGLVCVPLCDAHVKNSVSLAKVAAFGAKFDPCPCASQKSLISRWTS